MKLGFIGTGVMGYHLVHHLIKAGYEVSIFTRTKDKAVPLVELGAKWKNSIPDLTKEVDCIFTMVGYPEDVEQVYFEDEGIFSVGKEGQIVVDLTTSSPTLAKKIAKVAEEKGMHAVDAPVSGGDIGAKNGNLSIMCGGEREIVEKLYPILSIFGTQIIYQGHAGAGQHTKMCNQIAIATNMIGVCEALAYGKQAGLDLETVLKSITTGAAGSWSLSNLAPRMLQGDFEPGFYVKHFIKDMKIALTEAERMNLHLPGLQLAKKLYEELSGAGWDEKGTQSLFLRYL